MAGKGNKKKKKQPRFVTRSKTPGRIRGRRSNPRGRAEPRSGWSSIVPFARTLLSYLPGQAVVKPVSDFVFRGLGLSSAKLDSNAVDGVSTLSGVDLSIVGCGALFRVYTSDFLSGSRECIRYESRKEIETTVSAVRLHYVKMRIINPTPSGTRQGQWCAAFIPERSPWDIFSERRVPMTYRDVCQLPGAVIGPATRDLVLFHRFRILSGERSALDLGAGDSVGWVVITFEDLNREGYHEFTPGQFQCSVELSGQFTAYHSFGNNLVSTFSDVVQDYLASSEEYYHVRSTKDNANYRVVVTRKEKNGIKYKIDGTATIAVAPKPTPKPDPKVTDQLNFVAI